ncbi:MAG: hypothetical protein LQ338_002104 [Usnochroma carphineum]|nr:MAG: hypothetical protein LQ338_002104 [Usnochroma carphineum]
MTKGRLADGEFDFIIVGGGTAGLVVANRLTEDPHISVLVLEAGTDKLKDAKITTPGLLTLTYDDPQYDWSFDTVPQRLIAQENLYGKSVSHSRGKVIGGSSAINALALIYPPRSSIDAWERLGNKGWNWDTLAPYYRKFHTFNRPSKETAEALGTGYIDEKVQGTSGPIQSSFPEFHGPLGKAWPETFKNLNFPLHSDPLSGESSGGFSYLSTVDPKNWERSHAGSAYYSPVAARPNLQLLSESMVEKVIFEKRSDGTVAAKGISFVHNGAQSVQTAKKEVILCAGAIQSPQLLEVSGIGNSALLQSYNIEVVLDNPHVGENLQDHPMTGISFEVIDGLPTIDMIRDPQVIQGAMEAYQASRQGPLTSGFHSVASLPVVEFLSEEGRSELSRLLDTNIKSTSPSAEPSVSKQHTILRSVLESPSESSVIIGMGASQMHFDKSLQKDIYAITEPENYVSFLVALAQPFSRGSVHIKSASISDPPDIDPRYLSHPLDLEILARHVKYIPTIAATEPLASLIKDGGRRLPDGIDLDSLDSAKEYCKRNIITNNHPCGTCAMLPLEQGGVTDSRLRVYWVEGLRVVDASIFPMIPRGNIQSSVYAVAERAADLIKEDWGITA